jgi:hypothetical protein
MKKILFTLLFAIAIAFAIFAPSLHAQSSTPTSYPTGTMNRWLTMENQAVPTSPTVVTTSNLILGGGWVECTSARTITITDGNSQNIFPAVSVSANSIVSLNTWAGAYVSGGFSISASGSSCTYHVFWRQ